MGELIKLAWVAERVVKGRSGPGGRRWYSPLRQSSRRRKNRPLGGQFSIV